MIHEQRFTLKKISQFIALIEKMVYRQIIPIEPFRYKEMKSCEEQPLVDKSVDDKNWKKIETNDSWGKIATNFMLRSSFSVPITWQQNFPVALYLPLGEAGDFSHPEALAYIDGKPYSACDRHHQEFMLPDICRDGKKHLLALHGWTGLGGWQNLNKNVPMRMLMRQCAVVQIDQKIRDFVALSRVTIETAQNIDNNSPAKGMILNALDKVFKRIDTREPFGDALRESIYREYKNLKALIAKAGSPLDVDIIAAGHAHIDVAWLWTVGQTRRKSGRTFHTALRLMEQFKDYHFTQSQPQLYDYVKKDYPQLFEDIKKRVKQGRWEITGGMWVEADCNIIGHESLARQFLLGRTFFRENFGIAAETPILWLPDVFGYSANLPQLIKLAGLNYFFTTKISWNQYNRLPYDTFKWQGIDGTKVLTHFATTLHNERGFSTYNAVVTPAEVAATWNNFQQKELHQQLLISYGYGDGGGGPTREMNENIREMNNFPAMPRVKNGTAYEFFKKLEKACDENLPTWNGELYLEFHRGTYTTQSRNKHQNRKSEFLLHDAEFLGSLASMLDKKYSYPKEDMRKMWELLCLNQFHDIIPGSSIGQVYVDSQKDYKHIQETVGQFKDSAIKAIAAKTGGDIVLINPTSFKRNDIAFIAVKNKAMKQINGKPVIAQQTDKGTLISCETEPFSVVPLQYTNDKAKFENSLIAEKNLLENNFVRVQFDKAGDIISIYDKVNDRNVLPAKRIANQFQAFEDRPIAGGLGDAWDIDIFYDDKKWTSEPASSIKVVESGPLRATLEIQRKILNSNYVQRISLAYNSAQIDFDTKIDWHQKHILLKAAFPVEVLSSTAAYEVQWGHVERPTHQNTSWDWARFEVCAQKWIDLSEGNYGVSLLNDCKHGFDTKENVMRISLLRGTTGPDKNADQGEHQFKYSLLPHSSKLSETTVAASYMLNDPMISFVNDSKNKNTNENLSSLIKTDSPNVVIETIKKAENGKGIIVRLYESMRKRGTVTLITNFEILKASQTNLLEDDQKISEHSKNHIKLMLKPFEIMTLRIIPK